MPDGTQQLSVAILVRDEAEALRATLESVRDIADQIVVLDTGSIDASRGTAKELGAEVFDFAWCDDFSAARNECAQHATGKWLLWLDAGETIEESEATALRQFVDKEADPAQAYAMLVCVPAAGPSSAGEQVARLRLLPHGAGLRYAGRIRETVEASLNATGIRVSGIPYRIHRGESEHHPTRKAEKAQRNIRLAELQIKESGPTAALLNCLGDAFQTLNDNERAAQFFAHAVNTAEAMSPDMLEGYYGLLTSLDSDDKRGEQLDHAVKANESFPLDAQLLCAMGGYLQAAGRTDVATQCYETAYRYGQINPTVWHVAEVREIAAICYSITLQLSGELEKAEAVLLEALETESPSIRIRRHLIDLLVKLGRRDDALKQVGELPRETPLREPLKSAVRGACLAVKGNWIAAKAYLKTAYNAGSRDPICLRWLAMTLLSSGEQLEALPVIEEWRQIEPQNPEVVKLHQAAQQQKDLTDGAPRQWRVDVPDFNSAPPAAGAANPLDQLQIRKENS